MILLLLFSVAYGQSVDDIYLELSDMNFNAQKAVARASFFTANRALSSFNHISLEGIDDDMDGLITTNVTGNQILKSFVEYIKYCGDFPNILYACGEATESVLMNMDMGIDILEELSESDIYEDMLLHLDALSIDFREVVETCDTVNSSIYESVELVTDLWQTVKQLDPISYKLSLKLSAEYDSSIYTGEIVDSRQKNALLLYQQIHNTSAKALSYSGILHDCQHSVIDYDVINTDDIS
tara:strand:+ start:3452 stop:4168 length:717 start_codon:yes stop_codon:yes gene_type:complete